MTKLYIKSFYGFFSSKKDKKMIPVVEVWDRPLTKDAIPVSRPEELPEYLAENLTWDDINAIGLKFLMEGGVWTSGPFCQKCSMLEAKRMVFSYLKAFFSNEPKTIYIHVWKSRL